MSEAHHNRLGIFDTIRGILMAAVIFYHLLYSYYDAAPYHTIAGVIACVTMEIFFYFAGLFSQGDSAKSDYTLARILLMYAFFQIFFGILAVLSGAAAVPDITAPYYVYWFLLSLVILRFAARYIPQTKTTLAVLFVFGVLGGLFPDLNWHFALSNSIAYAPFFCAGLITDREKLTSFMEHRSLKHTLAGIAVIAAVIGAGALFISRMNPALTVLQMSPYETGRDLLSRMIIYILSCLMLGGVLLCVPAKQVPILTRVGRNSLPVYLLHLFPVILFYPLLSNLVGTPVLFLSASLVSALFIAWFFGRERVNSWLTRRFEVLHNALAGTESPGKVRFLRILTGVILLVMCGLAARRFF